VWTPRTAAKLSPVLLYIYGYECHHMQSPWSILIGWQVVHTLLYQASLCKSKSYPQIKYTSFGAITKCVESKRERMKKINCLSIQRERKLETYIRRREKENWMPTAKAGAQCRVPVPISPPHNGGRRGRWGQAILVGAGEANGGRKSPATCPSPPAPNTKEAIRLNP